ncbi:MAG: ATP-binding protein [Candidatus Sericytochromatia bacterium]|nr:ATP-binding protein [Candidatus Sericytochromatia bacterium]
MEITAGYVAEAVANRMAFDDEESGDVKLALIEACINAFEHSQSTDRQVFIKFVIEADVMKVTIADHGRGFDPSAVPRPEIKSKMGTANRKRGWGLLLIERLMDSVEIVSTGHGTTLTMTKRKQESR